MANFHATFTENSSFAASFAENDSFSASFGQVQYIHVEETYSGDYEVIPKFEDQVFDTDGKVMEDDMTVRAISIVQTTNQQGGKTVVIGSV